MHRRVGPKVNKWQSYINVDTQPKILQKCKIVGWRWQKFNTAGMINSIVITYRTRQEAAPLFATINKPKKLG